MIIINRYPARVTGVSYFITSLLFRSREYENGLRQFNKIKLLIWGDLTLSTKKKTQQRDSLIKKRVYNPRHQQIFGQIKVRIRKQKTLKLQMRRSFFVASTVLIVHSVA